VASDLFSGTLLDSGKVPEGLAEHMFASEYGWSLEHIRRLRPIDYNQHMGILLVKYRMMAIGNGLLSMKGK